MSLDYTRLNAWRWESIQQPAWRLDAQINEDYYDGNQLDTEALQSLKDRGVPPVVVNLVGPTIDLILGMEVRTRTDWIVRPEGEDGTWDDVSAALGEKLKEAERMTEADEACGSAYEDQVKAGVGWVEVSRDPDPFRYRYRVRQRDWREFWWDPRAEELDLSDARYLRRVRFYDRDQLVRVFPKKRRELMSIGPGYTGEEIDGRALFEADTLSRGNEHYRDYTTTELDWIDLDRDRLQLEEIWYRDWDDVVVIETPDGRVVEFDEKNPLHIMAVERGIAAMHKATVSRLRQSFWIGPLKLHDRPSPYGHNDFPYVPFWGYREKRTRTPYGIIRRMRPLQDEVNARRSKMLWGLSASRVRTDDDAVLDHDKVRMEVARRDAYIVLNSKRSPNSNFQVDDNFQLNDQQFKVYQDSKETLQDAGGVYQSMLGKRDTGADSGVAIQSLIEQGSTTLAKLNSNYRNARTRVGKLLLSLIVSDMAGREQHVAVDGARGRKTVMLNHPVEQHGQQVLDNDVQRAHVSVALDDVQASATFKSQQYMRMAELVSSLPPDLQAPLLDMVVEASDLPNRHKFAERIREIVGIAPDPEKMTDEQRQQMEAQAEKAAQEDQMMQQLAQARLAHEQAKAQREAARAAKDMADAERAPVDSLKTQAEAALTEMRTAEISQDIDHQEQAFAAHGPPEDRRVIHRW